MKKYTFQFTGNGWEYFFATIGWSLLLLVTLGLAMPFYIIWNVKWFATKLVIWKGGE